MGRLSRVLLIGVLASLPLHSSAKEGDSLSLSIPEKMINEALRGQTWEGEGTYDASGISIPYTWKLSEVSCSLKEGYADISGLTEINASGFSYQEKVQGRVKLTLLEAPQKIHVQVENLRVPVYANFLGSRKKIGELDLASSVGKLEVEAAPFLELASSLLPKDQNARLKSLVIALGLLKAEVTLKAKKS